MAKYDLLNRYLRSLKTDLWHATFTQIEAVLGFQLPASARKHQAWWSNSAEGGHSHARSWLEADWQTQGLNLSSEEVDFRRCAAKSSDGRLAPAIKEPAKGKLPSPRSPSPLASVPARKGSAESVVSRAEQN